MKPPAPTKLNLHPRNKHRDQYNFELLINTNPALKPYVSLNTYGNTSIDFFDPHAVKELNKSLLLHYYDLKYWDIPDQFLCPGVPGRADYIHHIADVLAGYNQGPLAKSNHTKCLDIGVGANIIYPIIGIKEYGWSFVGSDINKSAIKSGQSIIDQNPSLQSKITLVWQHDKTKILDGVVRNDDFFDLVICNPPFHASPEQAIENQTRKIRNLKKVANQKTILNFGGQASELWYPGGELAFAKKLITESIVYSKNVFLFSILVSKAENLKPITTALKQASVSNIHLIDVSQGQKKSRIVAWTFFSRKEIGLWSQMKRVTKLKQA